MDKIEVGKKLVAINVSGKSIVDNSVFSALSVGDKGEATAALMKAGGDIEFRESFSNLTDYPGILERLKKGEDVTFELEFNGVALPSGFAAIKDTYFAALKPIQESLSKLIPPYPFATKPEGRPNSLTFGPKQLSKGNYHIAIADAEKIWKKAAPYWVGNTRKPGEYYVNSQGRYVAFCKEKLEVGCQTVERWEVEEAARHYGWTFPKVLGK